MSVAKIVEVTAESDVSFEDAIKQGIDRTAKSVEHIEGAWIKEQKVVIHEGKITGYRVDMKITFVVNA